MDLLAHARLTVRLSTPHAPDARPRVEAHRIKEASEEPPFKWNSSCFGSPPALLTGVGILRSFAAPSVLKMPISESSEAAILGASGAFSILPNGKAVSIGIVMIRSASCPLLAVIANSLLNSHATSDADPRLALATPSLFVPPR